MNARRRNWVGLIYGGGRYKMGFIRPAAVAICLTGSDVSFHMPGEIQGLEHCSSELYPALDSEERRAACPEKRE